MGKRIQLPGSAASETAEFDARSNRFSAVERDTLAELIRWWQHRRAMGDAAEPLASLIGGVDVRATVTTTGLVPALAWAPESLPVGAGEGWWVQALGVPENPSIAGEIYSVVGLAHVYHDATAGYLARYQTVSRLPLSPDSTEIRVAVGGGSAVPGVWVVGVEGLVIGWIVVVWRLEVGH